MNFSNMQDWIKLILSLGSSLHIPRMEHHRFQIFVAVTCDLLWFYRNKAFHDGIPYDALQVSRNINKISLQHSDAWSHLSNPPTEKWMRPPSNWYKINFNTTIKDSFSTQAAVCRNQHGHILGVISQISH